MNFNKVTLETQYFTMPVTNRSIFPIRSLSVNLTSQEYPIGFNTTYFGENGFKDVTQLCGPTQDQTQNVITIPSRLTLIGTIILNGNIYTLPDKMYIYLDKLNNGVTDTITIKGQNPTLRLVFQLEVTYQFIQRKTQRPVQQTL